MSDPHDLIKDEYEEQILQGVARALWIHAYLNNVPESRRGGQGARLDVPNTPQAAFAAADDFREVFLDGEDLGDGPYALADFFELYMIRRDNEPFEFMTEQDDTAWAAQHDLPPMRDVAEHLGHTLANHALDAGAGMPVVVTIDFGALEVVVPKFWASFDGKEMHWHGEASPRLTKRNGRGNAAPLATAESAATMRVRAVLAGRDIDEKCSDSCPGWAVFDTDRGSEIQVCDECDAAARRLGLATVTDDEVALLPEARQELAELENAGDAFEGDYEENAGDHHASADQIWRVEVIDRQGPFVYRTRGTYDEVKTEAEEDAEVVSITPSSWRRNPAGLTRKGTRMYKSIEKGYRQVGEAKAKEVAARTVLSRAKHGTPGLVKQAKPAARTQARSR
jgi:hypothetical protein